ncbi:capsid assembly scaffolding protein Gp46 family protein [Mobiluncus curtisii]|uniref:capsid assembly scaffolding protein Gp46 family protein n=1 Tax=Mobiluncus curtisii TaxID=2051 RepID=UPI00242BE943|nr:DUF4355 domain-containing protein [Mobiluncus curtisii]
MTVEDTTEDKTGDVGAGKEVSSFPEKARELIAHLRERETQILKEKDELKRQLGEAKEQASKVTDVEAELAKYQAAYEEKEAELKTANDTAVKTRLLTERGIPSTFAQMLQGETEDEWTASADLLASFRDGAQADHDKLAPDPVLQASVKGAQTGGEDAERAALAHALFD